MSKVVRTIEIKVVPIGNSRGVRLPKAVLTKYAIKDSLVMEKREDGLLLRGKRDKRLSWEETYKEMAGARADWSDMDTALYNGLEREPFCLHHLSSQRFSSNAFRTMYCGKPAIASNTTERLTRTPAISALTSRRRLICRRLRLGSRICRSGFIPTHRGMSGSSEDS